MVQIVAVPGMGDVEFPDSMSDEQIITAIRKSTGPRTTAEELKRGAGLAVRSVIEGAMALLGFV